MGILSKIFGDKKETKSPYYKIFHNSVDLICIAKSNGLMKDLNSSFTKTLGWTREELLNAPFIKFIHPDDVADTLAQFEKTIKDRVKTVSFKNRSRKKDGSYIWLKWTCHPDTESSDLFVIAHDITKLVQLNNELIETIKFKDLFLTNMSHEIRTPMNAIIGFTDLLKKTDLSTEQQNYTNLVATASQNLLVIINDILDFSKIEAGKINLINKPISLHQIIENAIELTKYKAEEKNIKLLVTTDQDIPKNVLGDSVRLTQILINILNNAVKFTTKGSVQLQVIVTEKTNTHVSLSFSVKDTGIGIPKEKIASVFERFQQANDSISKEFGGTGLGLSIVKMLVELHGGNIHLNSIEGVGSDFVFNLSYELTELSPTKENIKNSINKDEKILENIHVLLAEDNHMNQRLAKMYLTRNGATVDLAENGKICTEKLQANQYDIILMDIHMPVMDGKEATKIIREELQSKIPIIACTADSLVGEKDRCLEIGMDAFISKPYTEYTMVHEIAEILDFTEETEAIIDETLSNPTTTETTTTRRIEILSTQDILDNIALMIRNEGTEFTTEILEIFNTNIPEDVTELKRGLLAYNYDIIREKAHKLAGSLIIFNFKKEHIIAKDLQLAAENKDNEKINNLSSTLLSSVNKILETTIKYNLS
ncbi:ATP-binding protein [Flavobacteriaceae bacterium]|nr:ATP-binding protein [Flavobacteriaceae bacterium]